MSTPTPCTAGDLHRLLDRAHQRGLQIRSTPAAAACGWFTVSSSQPGAPWYVVCVRPGHVLHGCDCQGYEQWQRCSHYALALDAAGLLPDLPDPEDTPPAPAPAPAAPIESTDMWTLTPAGRRELARLDLERRAAAEAVRS